MNIRIDNTGGALVVILGALLLLIGAIGGGFEIKELKIPKVGTFSRLVTAVGGIFLILLGIAIDIPTQDTPSAAQRFMPSGMAIPRT